MSTDLMIREPESGHVLRWLTSFGFNLVLLAGAAYPAGVAAGWAVVALSGDEIGSVTEVIAILYYIFLLPLVALGIIYASVLMALAWCIPEWGREIAIAGSAWVALMSVLFPQDPSPELIPFWCGVGVCVTVFAAGMHVDREAPPRWTAWIAVILPAPLIVAAINVIQLSGGAEAATDQTGRVPEHGFVDTVRMDYTGAGR
jgi:hypothetical protein